MKRGVGIVWYVVSNTVDGKGDVMRNVLSVGANVLGLRLVGCGDDTEDAAVEEVEDTSVENSDGGDAESEETE